MKDITPRARELAVVETVHLALIQGAPEPSGPPGLCLLSPFSDSTVDPVVLHNKPSVTPPALRQPASSCRPCFSPVLILWCSVLTNSVGSFTSRVPRTAARGSCCSGERAQTPNSLRIHAALPGWQGGTRQTCPDLFLIVHRGHQILFIPCLFYSP